MDLLGQLKSGLLAFEVDVHDDQVRRGAAEQIVRFIRAPCSSHHIETHAFQLQPVTEGDDGLVLDDDHLFHARGFRWSVG